MAQMKENERLKRLLYEQATRPLIWNYLLSPSTPWPWWRRWLWRYIQRPAGRVRHAFCCGREHDS